MSDVTEPCPLTAAVEIIGGRWSLIVLYALSRRSCRFNELQRLTPGVSHKVLTETVRALECHGLVNRDVGDGPVPCVRYSLSTYGQTLRPVIDAITEWGSEHLNASTARTRRTMSQPIEALELSPSVSDSRSSYGDARR